jgi:hypothetical protein
MNDESNFINSELPEQQYLPSNVSEEKANQIFQYMQIMIGELSADQKMEVVNMVTFRCQNLIEEMEGGDA